MKERKNKEIKILLGVSGGIAAYKSAELIRLFKKEGFNVKVMMTKKCYKVYHTTYFSCLI